MLNIDYSPSNWTTDPRAGLAAHDLLMWVLSTDHSFSSLLPDNPNTARSEIRDREVQNGD
jgi:hypothetical protein